MDSCSKCGSRVSEDVDRCLTCGEDVGAPNVRAAQRPAETDALSSRWADALSRAKTRGTANEVDDFARTMESSAAVVNCGLAFLREFVTNPSVLYSNYHRGVQAETRKAAEGAWDRDRVTADGLLFGSYSKEIRDAALTLTDTGLSSYGAYSLKLRDIAVAKRSSVLEENSFSFVVHHSLSIRVPVPFGYRCTWTERAKLAVAKLADFVTPGMNELEFQSLLLADTGDRAADRFMEVHIFGTFDREAIETFSGPKPKKRGVDAVIWAAVKDHLRILKKTCHEL